MSHTLAEAAPILRMLTEAVKDRSYVTETGLGPDVDRFLTYLRVERGKSARTGETYEYCLALMAVWYADKTLADFDGKPGTNLIRDFLREKYPDVQGSTWNTRMATVKSFFRWAFEESRIDYNPAQILRYRSVPETQRKAHTPSKIEQIVVAQPERRDRIGVQLLGRLGLRRSELGAVQFRHVHHETRELTVFGKGGTVKRIPIVDDLYDQILRESLERQAHPDEYLLYPIKIGRVGVGAEARMDVIWSDRLAPLSKSGLDKWWKRIIQRAGVEHFPMHELRHSAGTNHWRATRDLLMTQKLLRHSKIGTTADTYVHDDVVDLAESLALLPAWDVE